MSDFARILIVLGVLRVAVGLALLLVGRSAGGGRIGRTGCSALCTTPTDI